MVIRNEQTFELSLGHAIAERGTAKFANTLATYLSDLAVYDGLAIIAYFDKNQPTLLFAKSKNKSFVGNIEQTYLPGLYLFDPFFALHTKRSTSGLYRLSEIAPDRFRRDRYYLEFYKQTRAIDEFAFVQTIREGVSIHVCITRDEISKKKFSAKEIRALLLHEPIVLSLIGANWPSIYEPSGRTTELIGFGNTISRELNIHLSPRQEEVAMLVLQGNSNFSISQRLNISIETVKVFRKQIYKKCHISSQAELFNLLLPLAIPHIARQQT